MIPNFQTQGERKFSLLAKSETKDELDCYGILFDKESVKSFDVKKEETHTIKKDFIVNVVSSKDKKTLFILSNKNLTVFFNENVKNISGWTLLRNLPQSNYFNDKFLVIENYFLFPNMFSVQCKSLNDQKFSQNFDSDNGKHFNQQLVCGEKLLLTDSKNNIFISNFKQLENCHKVKFKNYIETDEYVCHFNPNYVVTLNSEAELKFRDHFLQEKFVLKTNLGLRYEIKQVGDKELVLWSDKSPSIHFFRFPHIKIFSEFKHPIGNVKEILFCRKDSEKWITSVSDEGNIIEISNSFKNSKTIYLSKDSDKKKRIIIDIVYDSQRDSYYYLNQLEEVKCYNRSTTKNIFIKDNLKGESQSFLTLNSSHIFIVRTSVSFSIDKKTKKEEQVYGLDIIDEYHSTQKSYCGENKSCTLYQNRNFFSFPDSRKVVFKKIKIQKKIQKKKNLKKI